MLKLPQNKELAEKIVSELFRIEQTEPNTMEWLRGEEKRLQRVNMSMKDEFIFRQNQGAMQLLDALFTHVREVRNTHDRLKGENHA